MSDIKTELVNGVMWSAIAKYSGIVVGIVVSMVLARILTPEDYGVVAISTVLIAFLSMFSKMGIGPAVIQRRDFTKDDHNNIFTFSCYVGVFLSILFFFGSWPIAKIYGNEQLVLICQILSVTLLFGAINMVPEALMMQNKRFKENAIRTLVLTISTGIISVIAAFLGLGIYSLLITPVISSVGIFFYNSHYYPMSFTKSFSLEPIKRIASYSTYQFLFELSNYFFRNFDKIIIGKYISTAGLGYYEKSYRLMQMPLQNVTFVIHPVLQPILSQLQDNTKEMAMKYNRVVSFVAMISFPIAVILYFNAMDIMLVMFGDQWLAAVDVFGIMALSIPLQMITSTSGAVFQAANGTKQLFWAGVISSVITIIAFLIGGVCFGTIEAVAWGWTISSFLSFVVSFYILYHFVFKHSMFDMLNTLINPAVGAIILCCSYFVLNQFLQDSLTPIFGLCIRVPYGLIIIITYLQFTGRIDFIDFVKNKIKK